MNSHQFSTLFALPSLMRKTVVAITLLSAAALVFASPAHAQDSLPACTALECPADYMQLEVNDIQYSPGLFKLQARVSQAKIPVGDAIFDQIFVNLVRPGAQNRVACAESIPNVRVRNSVLNLDIGRQMTSCQLDQVIAQEQDLAFEICINSPDNCLKPIPLGSTPYAIKSSYAVTAQKAHAANQSVQSHYAHRVTADTELFVGEREHEDGYFDFVTPDPNNQATPATTGWESVSDTLKSHMKSVYGADPDTIYDSPVGGFIQWTPVNPIETGEAGDGLGTLHLVAKDEGAENKVLKPLAKMMIHAEETFITGELQVVVRGAEDTIPTTAEVSLAGFNVSQGVAPVSAEGIHLRTADAQISDAGGTAAMSSGASSVSVDGAGMLCSADAQFGQVPDATHLDIYSYTTFHGTVEIPPENIQAALGEGSVSSFEIAPMTIKGYTDGSNPGDIALGTITSDNIKNGTITGGDTGDIAPETIYSSNIKNGTITGGDTGDIAPETIYSSNIKNGTIAAVDLAVLTPTIYGVTSFATPNYVDAASKRFCALAFVQFSDATDNYCSVTYSSSYGYRLTAYSNHLNGGSSYCRMICF